MKRIILISLLLLMAAVAWADAMPDFRLPDENGKNVTLSTLLGKGPILIDFWADYCKPCKEAMPLLNDLALKYDSLTVVLISIDKPKDQQRAKNYIKQNKFKFVTLFDADQTLAKKLNVTVPPQTFILNKDGDIVHTHKGFTPDVMEGYERHVRVLLNLESEAE